MQIDDFDENIYKKFVKCVKKVIKSVKNDIDNKNIIYTNYV